MPRANQQRMPKSASKFWWCLQRTRQHVYGTQACVRRLPRSTQQYSPSLSRARIVGSIMYPIDAPAAATCQLVRCPHHRLACLARHKNATHSQTEKNPKTQLRRKFRTDIEGSLTISGDSSVGTGGIVIEELRNKTSDARRKTAKPKKKMVARAKDGRRLRVTTSPMRQRYATLRAGTAGKRSGWRTLQVLRLAEGAND